MEGIYLLYIIPFVFIQNVYVQAEIVFPFKSSPATIKTGQTLDVACTLSKETPSAADATYEWYDKNGNVITNQNSNISPYLRTFSESAAYNRGLRIKIEDVSDDDSGTYKCKADVNGVLYESDFIVQVKASLEFKNCETSQFGVLGKTSQIHCTANAGGIPVNANWEKDGVALSLEGGHYAFDKSSMRIMNTTMSDEGVYKLSAYTYGDDSESKDQEISFEVYIAPTIVEPILQSTAVVGRKATLYCKARGKPTPEIEWRKAGSTNVLTTTDRINVTMKGEGLEKQGILEFLSVIKEDEAEYTCTAKNLATEANQAEAAMTTNKLDVQMPPQIENTNDATGTEGGAANLVCEARGDSPLTMIWQNVKSGKTFSVGYSDEGVSVTSEDIADTSNPGSRLVLAFTTLAHEDAGEYMCEAQNKADIDKKIVNLEVRYRPNFSEQEETMFYTWLEKKDSHITCTATANPEPVFEWYKGDKQIKAGDNYFSIGQPVVNEEKPHESKSLLYVTYNGQNDEAVFGKYTCLAKNQVGSGNVTMDLVKAERPKAPEVTVDKENARHMEFLLVADSVNGPEVTHFKVMYKQEGSAESAKEQIVEREYRDYIDSGRKYTVLAIHDLEASTKYIFTFYSKNEVGLSPGKEVKRTTPAISVPDMPQITTPYNSPYSDRIAVQWMVPSDGGDDILRYSLSYQQVEVKLNGTSNPTAGYELLRKITDSSVKDKIKDPSYILTNLIPGAYYQIVVYAHNGKGKSIGGTRIIKTKEADIVPGASTGAAEGLSTGVIIGIVIGVFFLLFIVVDLTCYFKNKCGILMSIREKVGGGREEGYAVAKTEDVENLAKKDELTEEVKAAEEGELAETIDDDKKAPLLSEEQKVDTIDEGETKPEKVELEPEDKDPPKTEETKPETETPKQDETPPAPEKNETPATDEKPSPDKPQE